MIKFGELLFILYFSIRILNEYLQKKKKKKKMKKIFNE